MSFPIVSVALPVATFVLLLLKKKPLTDDGDVKPPPDDKPIPVPEPLPPAPVLQTAVAMAPSGLNVRSAPNIRAAKLAKVPKLQRVSILEATTHPPTEGAAYGWWKVQTAGGIIGYASAEYLFFGTDKEAQMSDDEFKKYNEDRQNEERPIFQGIDFGACACSPASSPTIGFKGHRVGSPPPAAPPPRMMRLPAWWSRPNLYPARPTPTRISNQGPAGYIAAAPGLSSQALGPALAYRPSGATSRTAIYNAQQPTNRIAAPAALPIPAAATFRERDARAVFQGCGYQSPMMPPRTSRR